MPGTLLIEGSIKAQVASDEMHDGRVRITKPIFGNTERRGGGVVFDFRMGREPEGPKRFLGQFEGILQTDGYAGYDHMGGPKMAHAGCLAHARRSSLMR